MRVSRNIARPLSILLGVVLGYAGYGYAQVSPAEIVHPRLRSAEQTYFPQLVELNRAIEKMRFVFPFVLSRYAGLDSKDQQAADRRGLEFVNFRDRIVLKISGNYNAAFNSSLLTQNQRANLAYHEVIVPLLQLLPRYITPAATFDCVGFEISYHVRSQNRSYDYEGKENLVLVFDKSDALSYLSQRDEAQRQEILNRSEIYVNGNEFALALGARDPLDVESLDKDRWHQAGATPEVESSPPVSTEVALKKSDPVAGLALLDRDPFQGLHRPQQSGASSHAVHPGARALPGGAATNQDADALQTKYQPQLDALAKEGADRDHFVDYAPPSFVTFRNQLYLQITLRNPAPFDRTATSIYKRAAQSFDLFLASLLKSILEKVPHNEEIAGLDVTVLNQFTSGPAPSPEAVEYIFPLQPLQRFADADITNQALIDQSMVMVNGVRIALNLQQVE